MQPAIDRDVPLAPLTTLGVGGHAEYFIRATDLDTLRAAIRWAHESNMPVTVLGAGSNSLIADRGVSGLVIQNAIGGVWWHEQPGAQVSVTAGAGEEWDVLVVEAVQRDLWGIENLAAIPGSVGAAPVQNIGAYGAALSDVLTEVQAFDTKTGEVADLAAPQCQFGYRDSVFKQQPGRYIILSIMLLLQRFGSANIAYDDLTRWFADRDPATLSAGDVAGAVRTIRQRKFPAFEQVGTAGSFFKNPIISAAQAHRVRNEYPNAPLREVSEGYKLSAAWCIEMAGYPRGYARESVGLWRDHALVLVTHAGATSTAVAQFADEIATTVTHRLGVTLEWEVTQYGDENERTETYI